jgi:hypothetical protein
MDQAQAREALKQALRAKLTEAAGDGAGNAEELDDLIKEAVDDILSSYEGDLSALSDEEIAAVINDLVAQVLTELPD